MAPPQRQDPEQQPAGYAVRRPRSTDAIGQALRGAYDCVALPADMAEALRTLDRTPSRH